VREETMGSDMLLGGMTPLRPGYLLSSSAVREIGQRYGHGLGELTAIDRFRRDVAGARARVQRMIANAEAEWLPYVGIVEGAVDVIGQVGSLTTAADVLRLWDTLSSMARLAGPVGVYAGWFMDAARAIASGLLAIGEAVAIQWQSGHQFALENFIASQVLGLPHSDARPASMVMRALGWVPITFIGSGAFCINSGGDTSDWLIAPRTAARTVEENLAIWANFAGPRLVQAARCASWSVPSQAPWAMTDEGAASRTKAAELARLLSPRGFQPKQFLQGREAWAFRSDGLCFVNTVRTDLQPGALEYNVWTSTVLVRVTMLPDEMLVPLATNLQLLAEARVATGSSIIPSDQRAEIRVASWGPDDEAKKRWNLLRYLGNLEPAFPVIADELLRRHPIIAGGGLSPGSQKGRVRTGAPKPSKPWSTGEKVAAGGAALGAAALITKLLKVW
jgi:hypothetical protein